MRLILLCFIFLPGCVLLATTGGASVATVQTAQTIDIIKTGADVASASTTGKTITDHAVSWVVGKDCRTLNVFQGKKFCRIHKYYAAPKLKRKTIS